MNPLRAGLVPDLEALGRYPFSGHSALTGQVERDWQDTGTIRGYFAGRPKEAMRRYKNFVAEGVGLGRRPELVGGGLIRALGNDADTSGAVYGQIAGACYGYEAIPRTGKQKSPIGILSSPMPTSYTGC